LDFPDGISGPDISNGDLVNFRFPKSSLTLRVPKIPFNNDTEDRIAAIDWTRPDYQSWTGTITGRTKELVYQTWRYKDQNTHDNVALCFLEIDIHKLDGIDSSQPVTLNNQAFRRHVLNELILDEKDRANDPDIGIETRTGWPTQKNDFFLEDVKKPVLNGLRLQLDLIVKQSSYPMPLAVFILDADIKLIVSLTLESLHYSDRKNPFSEELLHQFKMDLFEEILKNIQIDYSPELVAQIEALK
jgi:hypothetical protein